MAAQSNTVWFQGWSGLKNGALLEAAAEAGFERFITADQEVRYQQNLERRKTLLVVLNTNNWSQRCLNFSKCSNLS